MTACPAALVDMSVDCQEAPRLAGTEAEFDNEADLPLLSRGVAASENINWFCSMITYQ